MENENKGAFAAYDGFGHQSGLTKLEYAVIHILAGKGTTAFLDDVVVNHTITVAKKLLKELDKEDNE